MGELWWALGGGTYPEPRTPATTSQTRTLLTRRYGAHGGSFDVLHLRSTVSLDRRTKARRRHGGSPRPRYTRCDGSKPLEEGGGAEFAAFSTSRRYLVVPRLYVWSRRAEKTERRDAASTPTRGQHRPHCAAGKIRRPVRRSFARRNRLGFFFLLERERCLVVKSEPILSSLTLAARVV